MRFWYVATLLCLEIIAPPVLLCFSARTIILAFQPGFELELLEVYPALKKIRYLTKKALRFGSI